jgi:peptidoglycan/LPS O-acetylase OafA/YrhL
MKEETQPVKHDTAAELAANHGKRSGYIPTLDGWRAIAIIWVIESHTRLWSVGGISSQWFRFHGDRGVQLFFALSGLLICSRLLDEEQRFGAISLRSFYTRRLFRIQPAAFVYLAAISVLMLVGEIRKIWSPVIGAALMVRDIWPGAILIQQTGHFWSLAVEEHFYLVFPGFLVLCRRYRLVLTGVMVVALEFWRNFVLHTPRLQQHAMVITLRTDMVTSGILLGCVFALALRRTQVLTYAKNYLYPWVALLYTAAVFARLELHHSRTDHALLITVYPVLLVATMLHPKSWTGRFLELRPLRFIGRISFSLYLWQQLFVPGDDPVAPHTYRTHVFLCWCAAFACAIASYYLIETPLVRRGHKIAKRFDLQTKQETYDQVAGVVPQTQ